MTTSTTSPTVPAPADVGALTGRAPGRTGNRVFHVLALGAGVLVMIVLALVGLFLLKDSFPALLASPEELDEKVGFMRGRTFWGYAATLVFGTLLASGTALVISVPLSVAVALFISHFAPRRLAQVLGYLVDLLAAIPSVVFGLWGFLWLVPLLAPVY